MQRNFNLIRLSIGILTFTLLNAYIRLTWIQILKNHLGLMHLSGCFIWWAHTDLNCGPTDYESAALTN